MYELCVGAIFKNEAHCMREWIEHYLFHGVEHFYLLNDGSTDDFLDVLDPYIRRGLITLYTVSWGMYYGRQTDLYCKYIQPHLTNKDMKWLLMIDLDEFVWSPYSVDLREILRMCPHYCQVQFNHTIFGSNGHEDQPASLVAGFTRRDKDLLSGPGCRKYIVNSSYPVAHLCIHHAKQENKQDEKESFKELGPEWFRINHYVCQSRSFWRDIKCTRGDVNNYRVRTEEEFSSLDRNDVEDTGLLAQNRPLLERLGLIPPSQPVERAVDGLGACEA